MSAILASLALSVAKKYIPSLVGRVLGDASGGVASDVISVAEKVTGVPLKSSSDVNRLDSVLSENPDLLVSLQSQLAEIELRTVQAFLDDRENARARDVALAKSGRKNWRADVMVLAAFIAVTSISCFLIFADGVESEVLVFLTTIGGMLMKNISTAFDYEYGSSRSSNNKSDDMSRAFDRLIVKG